MVVISSIDWDWKWQGPQEIAVRLARRSNRVLFIENPGVRFVKPKDAKRVLARLRKLLVSFRTSVRIEEEQVLVCTPTVLPPFGSRARRAANHLLLRLSVGRAIRRVALQDPVVFLCLPTDTSLEMSRMAAGRASPLVYYAISDLIAMTDHPDEMASLEERVIEEADLVFTTYLPLVERYGVERGGVHLMPYGVNLERFKLDGEVRRIDPKRPAIGYVGGISQHLDVGLIGELAKERPTWDFILIGPRQAGGEGLPDLSNIHLIGHLPHAELSDWVRGFDVCLIPYRRSRYTDTVYPVKLNEYLAMGRPVVSVNLPAVLDHEEEGVLAISPPKANTFLAKIEAMLPLSRDPMLIARRRKIAESHDWDRRVNEMARLIESLPARTVAP